MIYSKFWNQTTISLQLESYMTLFNESRVNGYSKPMTIVRIYLSSMTNTWLNWTNLTVVEMAMDITPTSIVVAY